MLSLVTVPGTPGGLAFSLALQSASAGSFAVLIIPSRMQYCEAR